MLQIITSMTALVIACVALYVAVKIGNKVEVVDAKVSTKNAMSLGDLADATETRRIQDIDPVDRTRGETEHMHDVAPDSPQPEGE